jgi:acyl-CoA dehydrogenase
MVLVTLKFGAVTSTEFEWWESHPSMKSLASDAALDAADRSMQTLGGMGYAKEYDVERHWREARLTRIAQVSQEMILNYVSEHVLGLPRSY